MYALHNTYFHGTRNCWLASHGHLLYRILPTSVRKYWNYEYKFTHALKRSMTVTAQIFTKFILHRQSFLKISCSEFGIIHSVHYSYGQSDSPVNAHNMVTHCTQLLKTLTCFDTEALSSGSLEYKGPQILIHQSRNATSNIKIFKIVKL
jgi:hypothetical protein